MASRRPGTRWVRGVATSGVALGLGLLGGLLGGCSQDPVAVDAPAVAGPDRATCERFVSRLPRRLVDEPGRTIADGEDLAAAWGDPPIVLTCGGDLPADFDRFAECVEANGVGWFVPAEAEDDQGSPATVTAAGYRPVVRVTVPAEHRPEGVAAVIAELADPVRDNLRLVDRCE